eukprot:1339713-Amphidinium_carterae.1
MPAQEIVGNQRRFHMLLPLPSSSSPSLGMVVHHDQRTFTHAYHCKQTAEKLKSTHRAMAYHVSLQVPPTILAYIKFGLGITLTNGLRQRFAQTLSQYNTKALLTIHK